MIKRRGGRRKMLHEPKTERKEVFWGEISETHSVKQVNKRGKSRGRKKMSVFFISV